MIWFHWHSFIHFDTAGNIYGHGGDTEDPYPSLSDFHDYEPNLEFDDTELEQVASTGKHIFSFNLLCGTTAITSFIAQKLIALVSTALCINSLTNHLDCTILTSCSLYSVLIY